MKAFFLKLFDRLISLIYIGVGLFVFLSLFSYHRNDVSFYTTSDFVIHNWMGVFGAYCSDFLFQWFGYASYLIPIFCFFWGLNGLLKEHIPVRFYRIFVLLITIFVSSVFLGYKTDGGTIGILFHHHFPSIHPIYIFIPWIICMSLFVWISTIPIKKMMIGLWRYKNIFYFKKVAPRPIIKPKPAPKKISRKAPAIPVRKKVIASSQWSLPSIDLLNNPKAQKENYLSKEMREVIGKQIEEELLQFGVRGRIVRSSPGPVVTLYEFEPSAGVKISRVIGLADNIALKMRVISVRMEVIPGTNVIGIEIPNENRLTVYIKELVDLDSFMESPFILPIILGKNIAGTPFVADLAKMPHLLVAGTTGSGKSVAINTFILSLLYKWTPDQCRMIMVDPKMLELSVYNGIPHLLTPVVTDSSKAVVALKWAVREMEDRYRAMAELGVRNIDGYNQKVTEAKEKGIDLSRSVQTGFDPETGKPIIEKIQIDLTPMPFIVIVVDEMADLMLVAGKEVEGAIQRLAQMARAAGIHLIMATQRPSVDVITGTIKANFPTRISFQVTSKIDSRTILNEQGAEQLLGKGDMLYMPAGRKPMRLHGPFVDDNEVEKVVNFWKNQGSANYVEAVLEESEEDTGPIFDQTPMGREGGNLYEKAIEIVRRDNKPSISYIQRQLRIGYNKAATLIEKMEADGIVSKPAINGKREVL